MKRSWEEKVVGDITVRDIIQSAGWSQQRYMESVVKPSHEGGETELILLAAMRGQQIRVFHDNGDIWVEYRRFGQGSEISRVVFGNSRYDMIVMP